jgi:hypothetical protein
VFFWALVGGFVPLVGGFVLDNLVSTSAAPSLCFESMEESGKVKPRGK